MNGRRHKIWLNPHINKPRDSADGIIGMKRAEYQMTGERGANSNFRGVHITNFSHHDRIGILPQNRTKATGERKTDFRMNLNLINAVQTNFNWIFNGYDFLMHRVDSRETSVKSGGFSMAG